MNGYTTKAEAIAREIVALIEAKGQVSDPYAAYDIDAIADEVIGTGYVVTATESEFWTAVQDNAR